MNQNFFASSPLSHPLTLLNKIDRFFPSTVLKEREWTNFCIHTHYSSNIRSPLHLLPFLTLLLCHASALFFISPLFFSFLHQNGGWSRSITRLHSLLGSESSSLREKLPITIFPCLSTVLLSLLSFIHRMQKGREKKRTSQVIPCHASRESASCLSLSSFNLSRY